MTKKFVYLLALLVSITAIADAGDDLVVGTRAHGDRIVLTEKVEKKAKFFRVVKDQRTFSVGDNERITKIMASEVKSPENGATVSVVRGGVRDSRVTLSFKSKTGHGIHILVEIYAKPSSPDSESESKKDSTITVIRT